MIRNVRTPLAIAAMVSLSWFSAAAQTAKPPVPPDPNASKVTVKATIEAIDKASRLVTLKGETGNLAVVYADQSIKRFDELKVGDTVSATYSESIAVNVRKPGEPAPAATTSAVTPSKGAPGATASAQNGHRHGAGDRQGQPVGHGQARGWRGGELPRPAAEVLDIAKVGDTVDITYTRALLLEVGPGK